MTNLSKVVFALIYVGGGFVVVVGGGFVVVVGVTVVVEVIDIAPANCLYFPVLFYVVVTSVQ